jgi:hypothetical protein
MIEQLYCYWWAFVVLGVAAGIVSGTLGVGSGIILVPALVVLWGVDQKAAQGTALAAMVPMALVGALRYWRNPQIEMNTAVIGLIVIGALVGTLAGTELAGRLPSGILRKIFACILLAAAIRMFMPSAANRTPPAGKPAISTVGKSANQSKSNFVHSGGSPNGSSR